MGGILRHVLRLLPCAAGKERLLHREQAREGFASIVGQSPHLGYPWDLEPGTPGTWDLVPLGPGTGDPWWGTLGENGYPREGTLLSAPNPPQVWPLGHFLRRSRF